jgi:hypothetical protein
MRREPRLGAENGPNGGGSAGLGDARAVRAATVDAADGRARVWLFSDYPHDLVVSYAAEVVRGAGAGARRDRVEVRHVVHTGGEVLAAGVVREDETHATVVFVSRREGGAALTSARVGVERVEVAATSNCTSVTDAGAACFSRRPHFVCLYDPSGDVSRIYRVGDFFAMPRAGGPRALISYAGRVVCFDLHKGGCAVAVLREHGFVIHASCGSREMVWSSGLPRNITGVSVSNDGNVDIEYHD